MASPTERLAVKPAGTAARRHRADDLVTVRVPPIALPTVIELCGGRLDMRRVEIVDDHTVLVHNQPRWQQSPSKSARPH